MQTINEVKQNTVENLSKDFEVRGNDWHQGVAKDFLKELDNRQRELGINKNKARAAVKAFWQGNFPEALKLIWGNKVITDKQNSDAGYKTTITYTISGWGTYTEVYEHTSAAYLHKIDLSLEQDENPDYALKAVYHCYVSKRGTDFAGQYKSEDAAAWRSRNVATIYNFLFVGFEGRDLSISIGREHCFCKNKIS